jgi:hypothetical protein
MLALLEGPTKKFTPIGPYRKRTIGGLESSHVNCAPRARVARHSSSHSSFHEPHNALPLFNKTAVMVELDIQ